MAMVGPTDKLTDDQQVLLDNATRMDKGHFALSGSGTSQRLVFVEGQQGAFGKLFKGDDAQKVATYIKTNFDKIFSGLVNKQAERVALTLMQQAEGPAREQVSQKMKGEESFKEGVKTLHPQTTGPIAGGFYRKMQEGSPTELLFSYLSPEISTSTIENITMHGHFTLLFRNIREGQVDERVLKGYVELCPKKDQVRLYELAILTTNNEQFKEKLFEILKTDLGIDKTQVMARQEQLERVLGIMEESKEELERNTQNDDPARAKFDNWSRGQVKECFFGDPAIFLRQFPNKDAVMNQFHPKKA